MIFTQLIFFEYVFGYPGLKKIFDVEFPIVNGSQSKLKFFSIVDRLFFLSISIEV